VGFARQLLPADHGWVGGGVKEGHAQDGPGGMFSRSRVAVCRRRRRRQGQDGLGGREKEHVPGAAGEEVDPGIGLPPVRLEVQGQLAVGLLQAGFDRSLRALRDGRPRACALAGLDERMFDRQHDSTPDGSW
jgi:hypothetical protein